MPKQKDEISRSPRKKAGESHTAVGGKGPATPDDEQTSTAAAGKLAETAGASEKTVLKQTGRSWAEWLELLDAFGATEKPHRDVAAHVESLGVPAWWAQTVTVGYERIRGLREKGQRRSGSWEASRSRTFSVPVESLFDAFADEAIRREWLGATDLTVRKSTPPKSMRITWSDGTSVELWFTARGEAKSSVSVQHTKLESKADADERKQFWSERLDRLSELFAG